MNIQTDPNWTNEIMTEKEGVWTDTLGRYGCLVTCLANIVETIMLGELNLLPQKTLMICWYIVRLIGT